MLCKSSAISVMIFEKQKSRAVLIYVILLYLHFWHVLSPVRKLLCFPLYLFVIILNDMWPQDNSLWKVWSFSFWSGISQREYHVTELLLFYCGYPLFKAHGISLALLLPVFELDVLYPFLSCLCPAQYGLDSCCFSLVWDISIEGNLRKIF